MNDEVICNCGAPCKFQGAIEEDLEEYRCTQCNAVYSLLPDGNAPKFQLIRYVVIPESASHLLGQMLYMFDYNVRQSTILGIVGAGGIGFYVVQYIKFFEYGKVAVFMFVVLIVVLGIDWASVKIRDKYIIKSQHGMEVPAK